MPERKRFFSLMSSLNWYLQRKLLPQNRFYRCINLNISFLWSGGAENILENSWQGELLLCRQRVGNHGYLRQMGFLWLNHLNHLDHLDHIGLLDHLNHLVLANINPTFSFLVSSSNDSFATSWCKLSFGTGGSNVFLLSFLTEESSLRNSQELLPFFFLSLLHQCFLLWHDSLAPWTDNDNISSSVPFPDFQNEKNLIEDKLPPGRTDTFIWDLKLSQTCPRTKLPRACSRRETCGHAPYWAMWHARGHYQLTDSAQRCNIYKRSAIGLTLFKCRRKRSQVQWVTKKASILPQLLICLPLTKIYTDPSLFQFHSLHWGNFSPTASGLLQVRSSGQPQKPLLFCFWMSCIQVWKHHKVLFTTHHSSQRYSTKVPHSS